MIDPRDIVLSGWTLTLALALGLSAGSEAPGAQPRPDGEEPVDFFRDVRPILSQHCFQCHGPDEEQREAEMRLDRREDVFADRGGYAVVVAGDPDASEMLLRITDDADPMPPPDEAEPLTDAQKETLRRWVAEGADWPEHWSFSPPTRPALPDVDDDDGWVRDPIDRFVLARLAAGGLAPEEEATRAAWLRRVSFDLTGMPPTPKELDAFLADEEPGAHERQVDRLFASKRYGERQAQDWLDLARYADSNGNQFDEPRTNWKWRDWVIDAYNANMPFDRFTVEQLAGDMLPDPTREQLIATGFNRNHQTDTDQPLEPDEYRTEYVIDRVDTTATTWMGLTLACAQCHDHKYDPISQEDFYSFYSFFNNVAEHDIDYGNPRPRLRVPNPDQEPKLRELEAAIDAIEERLQAADPMFDGPQAAWEEAALAALGEPAAWTVLEPVGMLSRGGALLRVQDDGSILASGPVPVQDTYDLVVRPGVGKVQALKLEVFPDPADPEGASGRSDDGTFRLKRLEVRHASLSDSGEAPLVYMSAAQADFNQELDPAAPIVEDAALPGEFGTAVAYEDEEEGGGGFFGFGGGWTLVGNATKRRHEALLIPLEPLTMNEASLLKIAMEQSSGTRAKGLISRFRWSMTDDVRVREQLLPMAPQLWSTLGPYPAATAAEAYEKEYPPEEDIDEDGIDRAKRYPKPKEPEKPEKKDGKGARAPGAPGGFPGAAPEKPAEGEAKPEEPEQGAPAAGAPAAIGPPAKPAEEPAAGAEAKPEAPKEAEADDEADEDEDDEEAEVDPLEALFGGRRQEPEDLSWKERKTWRDGERESLDVETGAYYLTRKIVCERAGTAVLRLDGPAGVKVWLNGEVVFEEEPPPPTPEEEPDGKTKDGKEQADDEDEDEEDAFDFFAFFAGLGGGRPEREVLFGFRKGTNELVVKSVFAKQARPRRPSFGGGGFGMRGGSPSSAITFDFTPRGADVMTYEVMAALRAKAAEVDTGTVDLASVRPLDATMGPPGKSVEVIPTAAAPPDPKPVEHRRLVLRDHYREHVSPIGAALHNELARLEKELAELEKKVPEAMVMAERAEPRQAYVFLRGDWRQRGEDVGARTPLALPPMPDDLPRNRLGLARWLVSGEHPLTARVAVNRMWQQLLGTGLVATPEDFGIRAATPTHPELLDWLAVELVESGWDVKALQKRLVLSATYRQDCTVSADKLERDPDNALLSRGPRERLSAEMIRDNALAVSGLLVEEVGGPSVKPYQASGLWSEVTGGRDYKRHKGEKQYRRGLYVYWKRRLPYPSMVTFDASKGERCTVKRPETTTPTQALVLLNNPVYVEAARVLGQRLLKEGGKTDAERLAYGFRLCTSRAPSEKELAILTRLLGEQRAAYEEDEKGARKLLAIGDAKFDESLDARELATWAAVASALLNLDATIHRG